MAGLRTTRAAETRPPDFTPLHLIFPLGATEHFEAVGQPGLSGSVPLLGMDGVEAFRDIRPFRTFQVRLEGSRVELAAGDSQAFGRPVGRPEQAVRNGDGDLHGWSITISYPTVKARLNRIAEHLDFVDIDPAPTGADVVDRLRRGEISAQEALDELEKPR